MSFAGENRPLKLAGRQFYELCELIARACGVAWAWAWACPAGLVDSQSKRLAR